MAGWQCTDRENIFWDGTINAKTLKSNNGTIQHTPDNEDDIVNKKYVDDNIRSAVDLFLTNNASDIGGYKDLEIDVVTAAEETITQTITGNSTTLIASFASILDEPEIDNITLLEKGIYALHIHALTNFSLGMTFFYEFYHRTAGGTETLLCTSHDSSLLTISDAEYDVHCSVTNDKMFVAGDRIVIKVIGKNAGAANKDISIVMEGTTATRVEFPGFISPGFVPAHASEHEIGGDDLLDHNSITGIGTDDHHAKYTDAEVDTIVATHAGLSNAHHNESHTIASHSDTTGTGAELNELTDGSETTLHSHAAGGGMIESAEQSSTPVADDFESSFVLNGIFIGNQITLPTTEKHYIITAIEWKNGTTVAGNVVGSVWLLDSEAPVAPEMLLVAQTPSTAQSGTSSVQKASVIRGGLVLAGGTKITGAFNASSSSAKLRFDTVSTQNLFKTFTFNANQPIINTAGWGQTTIKAYIKIYFKGYS